VLFFISLASRRIEHIACSSNPDGRWVAQQARNLVMLLYDLWWDLADIGSSSNVSADDTSGQKTTLRSGTR
jgi:hypothetical protein